MRRWAFVMLVALVIGAAYGGFWEDYGIKAVQYVTDPSTPTTDASVGLVDQSTGLLWVNGWGSTTDAPRLNNPTTNYKGSFFYNTAVVILGESKTGVNIDLGHLAVNYVFHSREDAGDTLDEPAAGGGIEPWWSHDVSFNNGNFDLPTGLIVPDASFWNRNIVADHWPTDTGEVSLEWMLWDAIFLVFTGDPFYQDELDSIIAGIVASPYYDPTDSILQGGAPSPYLTALWVTLLAKYNQVYGTIRTTTSLMRVALVDTGDTGYVAPDFTYYQSYLNKAVAYLHTSGMDYLRDNYMGEKNVTEGQENYEALAFLMAYSLTSDTVNANTVFNTYIIDAGPDNDGTPWGFFNNIKDFADNAHSGTRYFPITARYFDAFLSILALKEYHDFVLPFDFDEADTCADWIRDMADSAVVKAWADSAGRFVHNPNLRNIPATNGLAGYSMLQIPRLEIFDIVSDLPRVGDGLPYDYYANRGQNHNITVTVIAYHTIANNSDTLWVNRVDCFGGPAPLVWNPLPDMSPGDTAIIVFNINEPMCVATPADDSLFVTLTGPHTAGWTLVDNDLLIEVDSPADLTLDDVYAVADTMGVGYNEPFFTEGQNFWLAVEVTNNGDAPLYDITFNISSSSVYGCSSVLSNPYVFPDTLASGVSATYYLPITADPTNHGATGGTDDEIFTVVGSATDLNIIGAAGVTYMDDDDSIGIVMPPSLSVIGWDYWAWGTTADLVPWLNNSWGGMDYYIYVYSDTGDYAVADSLWENESFLQFWSSEITGIGGADVPLDITDPSFGSTIDAIAPGDTAVFDFWLWDEHTSEEDTADVEFTSHFHDFNDGDAAEASTSPLDALIPHSLAIDITNPVISMVAPVGSGDPWPADNHIKVMATDNFSKIDTVIGYITNSSYTQWWDGSAWVGAYTELGFEWDTLDQWISEDAIDEPTGNCYMVFWAIDSAGNVSDDIILPRGTVAYINIYDVLSDLPKQLVPGEVWQADWEQAHLCSVHIYNPNTFDITNVVIGFKSSSPNTEIRYLGSGFWNFGYDEYTIATLPAGGHVWVYFEVIESWFDFRDSLCANLVSADPGPAGQVIGQQITDNDAVVEVETPVMVIIRDTWIDTLTDAPVKIVPDDPTAVEDTNLVTQGQDFTLWVRVCYWGEDDVDSMKVVVRNGALIKCQATSDTFKILTQADFATAINYNDTTFWCVDVPFEYLGDTLDVGACNGRSMEDMFISGIEWVDWDNWDFDMVNLLLLWDQVNFDDTLDYASVLEPPELDITDATISGYQDTYTGRYWINSWDTVIINVAYMNLCSSCPGRGRATADSLDVYPMPLAIFDPLWSDIGAGLVGLDVPVLRPDTLYPCQDSLNMYMIYWDGVSSVYEGYVGYIVDTLYFHDKDWPSQTYPVAWLFSDTNAYGDSIFISAEFDTISKFLPFGLGIDVILPVVDVYYPVEGNRFNAGIFPDSSFVLATDNFSGVVKNSVECQIIDPHENYWNGGDWQTAPIWLITDYIAGDTFAIDLPIVDSLMFDGEYMVVARCSDVAGNGSDYDTLRFIYDSADPRAVIIAPPNDTFYNCSQWDGVIRVHAWDTLNGVYNVAGIRKVYIGIEDTVRDRWWNAGTDTWVISPSWIWNEMTYIGGEMWEFSGYTPPAPSYIFRLWTFADDSVLNFDGPTDTTYFVLDCQAPHSYITDSSLTDTPPSP